MVVAIFTRCSAARQEQIDKCLTETTPEMNLRDKLKDLQENSQNNNTNKQYQCDGEEVSQS